MIQPGDVAIGARARRGQAKTLRVRKWKVETVCANCYSGATEGRDMLKLRGEVRGGVRNLGTWRQVAACDAVASASQNTSSADPSSGACLFNLRLRRKETL